MPENITIKIAHYGTVKDKATKETRYKVANNHIWLFEIAGWEFVRKTSGSYCQMRAPDGHRGKEVAVPLTVPTIEEIIEVARKLHAAGEEANHEFKFGTMNWGGKYKPAHTVQLQTSTFSYEDPEIKQEVTSWEQEAEFQVGHFGSWYVSIKWNKPDGGYSIYRKP